MMVWFSMPAPRANEMATIMTFWASRPDCTTVRMPSTKISPMAIRMYAPMTGAGMVRRRAGSLGNRASSTKAAPMTYPTRCEAMPVSLASDTLVEE